MQEKLKDTGLVENKILFAGSPNGYGIFDWPKSDNNNNNGGGSNGDPKNDKSEYLNQIDDISESADRNCDPKNDESNYSNQNNDQANSADYNNSDSSKFDNQNNDDAKFSESKEQENVPALKLIIRYKKELG